MEVVVKENPANKHMHNPNYVTGVIPAPDWHYEPLLFSHYQATKDYNKMDQDIFINREKYAPADRKKTPKSVFAALGIAASFILWKTGKYIFKK